MAFSVASLTAKLSADTSDLESGLKRGQAQLEETGARARGMGGIISSALSQASASAASAASSFTSGIGQAAAGAGAAVQSAMSGAAGAVASFGQGLADVATKAALVGAVTGTALLGSLVAVGKAGVDAWSDMDAAADTLMQRTGATGDALDALTQSVANLRTGTAGVGESMAHIGETMADVAARTGATGPALESLTGTLLQLEHIQGQGAVSAAEFGRTLNSWNVPAEQGSALLDQLFVASQKTGVSTGQLSQSLTQFGGPLREMGFGLGQSIAMLSQLDAAGLDSSVVMTGLRTATAELAKSGTDIQSGLGGAFSAIQDATNDTEALQIAIDTFGARAGPAFADAIKSGKLSLEDASAAMGRFEGAIGAAAEGAMDFPDRMAMAMARVQTALVPVGQAVMNLADMAMPAINVAADVAAAALGGFAAFLGGLPAAIAPFASALSGIFNIVQNGGGFVGNFDAWADGLTAAFGPDKANLIISLGATLAHMATSAQSGLSIAQGVFASFGASVMAAFGNLLPLLAQFGQTVAGQMAAVGATIASLAPSFIQLGTTIGATIAAALPLLLQLAATAGQVLVTAFQTVAPVAMAVFNAVATVVQMALPPFLQLANAVGQVLIAAFNALQPVAAAIIGAVQTLAPLVGGFLAQAFTTLAGFLTGTVVPALTNLGQWLAANLPGAIQTLVGFWTGTLLPAIQTVAGWVSGTLFPLFAQLVGWLGSTITGALAALSAFWQQHGATILAAAQGAWNTIQSVIQSVLGTITGLWQAFQSAREGDWRGFGEKLRDIWDASWEAIKSVITTAGPKILAALGALLTDIKTAFTSVDWLEVGRNVIQGIANGLGAAGSILQNAARTAATNALDALKGALGIRSPSRVAAEQVGVPIAQGIAAGMSAGLQGGALDAALDTVKDVLLRFGSFFVIVARTIGNMAAGAINTGALQQLATGMTAIRDVLNAMAGIAEVLPKVHALGGATEFLRNTIAGFVIFAHDVLFAAGPARGGVSGDVVQPLVHLADGIKAIFGVLADLGNLWKSVQDLWKGGVGADALNRVKDDLGALVGAAAGLVTAASSAALAIKSVDTSGLAPLKAALDPLVGIATGVLSLAKAVGEALKYDWGATDWSAAGTMLAGMAALAVYLTRGAADAALAIKKIDTSGLAPLKESLDGLVAVATGTFSLAKVVAEALKYDWRATEWSDAAAMLRGMATLAVYLSRAAAEAALRIKEVDTSGFAPLKASLDPLIGVAEGTMSLARTVADALKFPWAADYSRAAAMLLGLASLAVYLTRAASGVALAIKDIDTSGLAPLKAALDSTLGIGQTALQAGQWLADTLTAGLPRIDLSRATRAITTLVNQAVAFVGAAAPAALSIRNIDTQGLAPLKAALDSAVGIVTATGQAWQALVDAFKVNWTVQPINTTQIDAMINWGGALLSVIGPDAQLANLANIGGLDQLQAFQDYVEQAAGVFTGAGAALKALAETLKTNWTVQPVDTAQIDAMINWVGGLLAVVAPDIESQNLATIGGLDALKRLADLVGQLETVLTKPMDILKRLADWMKSPILLTQGMQDEAARLGTAIVDLFTAFKEGVGPALPTGLDAAAEWAKTSLVVDPLMKAMDFLPKLRDWVKAPITLTEDMTGQVMALASALVALYTAFKNGALTTLPPGTEAVNAWAQTASITDGLARGMEFLPKLREWTRAPIELTNEMLDQVEILASNLVGLFTTMKNGIGAAVLEGAQAVLAWAAVSNIVDALDRVMGFLPRLQEWTAQPVVLTNEMLDQVEIVGTNLVGIFTTMKNGLGTAVLEGAEAVKAWADVASVTSGLETVMGFLPKLRDWVKSPTTLTDDMLTAVGTLTSHLKAIFGAVKTAIHGAQPEAADLVKAWSDLFGSVLNGLEAGFKLPDLAKFLVTYQGFNFAALEGKLDLLIADLIAVARKFGEKAKSANISDEWKAAGEKVAALVGNAGSSIKDTLDVSKLLLDPETVIPSIGQMESRLTSALDLALDIVKSYAAKAKSLTDQSVDTSAATKLADNIKAVVDSISAVAEMVKKFEGIRVSGSWGQGQDAGSSGFENIRKMLADVFSLFSDVAGQAGTVEAVSNAISTLLGGLTNLAAAQGVTAGEGWGDAFARGIRNKTAAIQEALKEALGGALPGETGPGAPPPNQGNAGSGTGGGRTNGPAVNGTYIEKQVNVNVTQYATSSALNSSASNILTLDALYG